ncbi:MAG: nitroreductase family protein [Candidatus Latescibacteria bacterium]|nr:nitroreductase family protein [Candidatus Latescibacterota bacterium]
MPNSKFIPLNPTEYPASEMQTRAEAFHLLMQKRRTIRDFSDRTVPQPLITTSIQTAGTAPSGANKQPWHFVAISDPIIKKQIKEAAEEEEREFYTHRAPQRWLDDLAPFGTDANKPFLETAPWLIAIFAQRFGQTTDGDRDQNYYVAESVGIATGLLITALHNAGLATLTHTPSPMKFLNTILNRPDSERPFLLLVVGYPTPTAQVPNIQRKSLDEIATFHT